MAKKILLLIFLSLAFGIIHSYSFDFYYLQILVGSTFPFLITVPIFIILCVYQYFKGTFKSSELFDNFWAAFKPVFIVLTVLYSLGLLSTFINKKESENKKNDPELHKSTVLKENKNSVKEIGAIDSEILNKDNLYENFNYHYAILFPKDYKVDYGIGKHSQIQAYNEENGNTIIITSFPTDKEINEALQMEETDGSKEFMELLLKSFETPEMKNNFEKTLCERGFTKVNIKSMVLTSFANTYFIKVNSDAKVMYDNKEFPVKLVTFTTYKLNNIYTVTFRSWESNFNKNWKDQINQTMGNFVVSNTISKP
jgi:hypothetical protein